MRLAGDAYRESDTSHGFGQASGSAPYLRECLGRRRNASRPFLGGASATAGKEDMTIPKASPAPRLMRRQLDEELRGLVANNGLANGGCAIQRLAPPEAA